MSPIYILALNKDIKIRSAKINLYEQDLKSSIFWDIVLYNLLKANSFQRTMLLPPTSGSKQTGSVSYQFHASFLLGLEELFITTDVRT
jgi:hypothetical protein